MDAIPSTSTANYAVFDDNFIKHTRTLPVSKLKQHLALLEKDSHPLLESERNRIKRDKLVHLDRIKCHRDRAERRAKEDIEKRERNYKEQMNARKNELYDECFRRGDDLAKNYEHEYATVDITKPPAVPISYETNKKTLRGRGGGQLIEPQTYFNSNQVIRIPEFKAELGYDNDTIRHCLEAITKKPEPKRRPGSLIHSIVVQKPKLIIDNKSFKQGEDVYASNKTFGEFLARLEIMHEKISVLNKDGDSEQKTVLRIVLKGSNSWDPRQITATVEDLEDGRVTITKQKDRQQ